METLFSIIAIVGLVLGIIFLVVLIRFFYILFFFLPIKLVNKLFASYARKERFQARLQKKSHMEASLTVIRFFKNIQGIIGISLIALYSAGSYYIGDLYGQAFGGFAIGILFFCIVFLVGRPKYKACKKENNSEITCNNDDILIEGLDIDVGDIVGDVVGDVLSSIPLDGL